VRILTVSIYFMAGKAISVWPGVGWGSEGTQGRCRNACGCRCVDVAPLYCQLTAVTTWPLTSGVSSVQYPVSDEHQVWSTVEAYTWTSYFLHLHSSGPSAAVGADGGAQWAIEAMTTTTTKAAADEGGLSARRSLFITSWSTTIRFCQRRVR
jgi:hypothetical protein